MTHPEWCGKPLPLDEWVHLARWTTFGPPPSESIAYKAWLEVRGPYLAQPMHGACCIEHVAGDS